ncbi:hypothetical protein Z517_09180 [Fonsecaea pedrosoi CBS 271.37]|uniref:TauD/TfdA-like domain-containing protein n=1 Tax=Fonsecaea pedrosoi CBS 271.37 TaxID=1442368 RepID=A0A0D2DGC6_9EURO|nr:uncharacterized protein Z517_09180 [Fonsecaea pedrosoi CBS 271.37]KIW76736.1 hypothetical protein Z517_09180 [Fonsecaea pedrosoi CBS 271.37]
MAPAAITLFPEIRDVVAPRKDTLGLPEAAVKRLTKAGIDLSQGYPYRPAAPLYLDDVYKIRSEPWDHIESGVRADRSKKALFSAASKVTDFTAYVGTQVDGLQLKDLTPEQKDELGLLIAERGVVVFPNQDLSPQEQLKLGEWYGKIEIHPQAPIVPGLPGVTVLWPDLQATERSVTYRNPGGAAAWHTDLVHEPQPASVTHLHNDVVPTVGGDTLFASGYAAYEKLSPAFRKIIDGRSPCTAPVMRTWTERTRPRDPTLWVNRQMTLRIVGLDPGESDAILNCLYHVYETNVDIQARIKWTAGTSVLWDNRIMIHNASWDYAGREPRHGTRVTSLGEKPYFDPDAPTRRQALGQLGPDELEEDGLVA